MAEAHNRSRGILTSVSHSGNRCAAATLDLATTPLQAFTFAVVNMMHASQMIYAAYAVCMQTKPAWKCSSRRRRVVDSLLTFFPVTTAMTSVSR